MSTHPRDPFTYPDPADVAQHRAEREAALERRARRGSTNPLVSQFWSASEPPAPAHRHYRDAAIEDAPERAGDQCGIPLERIGVEAIGLPPTGGNMEERGTLYCTVCPDYPQGCKLAASDERRAAFRAHLDGLRANNEAARRDHTRALRHAEPAWDSKWCSICGQRIGSNGARGLCARHYSQWRKQHEQEEAA